ncbi:MAG: flagellar motor switch protein FliN [Deltaproteobacteria bacterium]|nr:flagellar motor switch protein FliN [Deltaproteobacteria bacterium]
MADDLDFDSFENLDELDWSELEKNVKEGGAAAEGKPKAAPAAAAAMEAPGPAPHAAGGKAHIDLNYLLDVNLQVTVEVGRKQYFISEILSWDHDSIIEMEKLVGESLNLLVNNKPVAKGEVVVVNDKFALKITEIMAPNERVQLLNS